MQRTSSFIAWLFLVVFFALATFSASTKSPTHDEFAHHTASGFSHLVTADFRMNPAEPPLSRLLSAIPLYFVGAKAPLGDPSWQTGDSPAFAQAFFYGQKLSQDQLIFWARLPIAVLAALFGYFVFVWSRDCFGAVGGLISLALFSFCPDMIAHSGLATSDACVSFFFFLTLWRLWKYFQKPQRIKNTILVGVFMGLSFLSKFSAILLLPTIALILTLGGQWKAVSVKRTFICFAAAIMTIWSGYFFEVKPLLKNTPDPEKKIAVYERLGGQSLVRFAKEAPVPLSTFVSAFTSMMVTRSKGTNAFFMGEWSHGQKSWWPYYLTAFSIKNTLPFLFLLLISGLILGKSVRDRLLRVFLLVPISLFFAATLQDKAQAGLRYFLPIYPFCFMLCAAGGVWLWQKRDALKYFVAATLAWHSLEALRTYPDYLSYFNASVGGADRGYLYLRDSNIDWGQDLKGVARWAQANSVSEIVLGSISPVDMQKAYGIPWRVLSENEHLQPEARVYALGVHIIDGIPWVKNYLPDKIVGHSMWIYDFRPEKGRVVG